LVSSKASKDAVMPTFARGFTLAEALIALSIIALLSGLAVPAFTRMIRHQQLNSASMELAAAFAYARQESITRRCPVLIDHPNGRWENGWRVFADVDNDGRLDRDEPLLKQARPLPAGIRISGNTPVRRYVRYTPTGATRLIGGGFQAGTLTLCHADGQQAVRKLILNAAGRMRRSRGEPGGC